jgi:hypothetical protein
MVMAEDADGFWGMFKYNSIGTVLVMGSSASVVQGSAPSLNVTFSSGVMTIQNNTGADRRFHVSVLG